MEAPVSLIALNTCLFQQECVYYLTLMASNSFQYHCTDILMCSFIFTKEITDLSVHMA